MFLFLWENTNKLKALDIVKTPKGAVAIVGETQNEGADVSITFICDNIFQEKNSWWSCGELQKVNSLPKLLALMTAHPFGSGKKDVEIFF